MNSNIVYKDPWNYVISSSSSAGYTHHSKRPVEDRTPKPNNNCDRGNVLGSLKDRIKRRQNHQNSWECQDMRSAIGLEINSWIKPSLKRPNYEDEDDCYNYNNIYNYGKYAIYVKVYYR
jgi:hypothetical protein